MGPIREYILIVAVLAVSAGIVAVGMWAAGF